MCFDADGVMIPMCQPCFTGDTKLLFDIKGDCFIEIDS